MKRRSGRRAHLILFVKEPVAGRVKSRLAAGIGSVHATWWYRHAGRRLLRSIGGDARWETWLAITPERFVESRGFWSRYPRRIGQGRGSLGARLDRALASMPPGPVLVIGSDIPGVSPRHVARAFRVLGHADWVLGPAPDGGYWSIGWCGTGPHPRRNFLSGVRWSGPHALADTLEAIGRQGRVALLDTLADVDTVEDLVRWRRFRGAVPPPE